MAAQELQLGHHGSLLTWGTVHAGEAVQVSCPLSGLAVGHTWRHHLCFDRPWAASVAASVHLCHSLDMVST